MKRHNDYRLGEVLKTLQQQPNLEPKLILEKIKTWWQSEMGEYILRQTKTLSVSQHKLYVRLDSSVLKDEMRFQKKDLVNKINSYLDYPYIQDIIFH